MDEPKVEENKSKKKKGNSWKLLAILLIILCLGEGYYIYRQSKNIKIITVTQDSLKTEKQMLTDSLTNILTKYDSMKTNNADMQAKIDSQKVKIIALLKTAQKVKNDDWIIYKLNKSLKLQRQISQHYVEQLDSVNQANQRLIVEKNKVTNALHKQQNENQSLTKTNEGLASKVKTASLLRVRDLSAYGLKIRKDRTGKKRDRAKNVDWIQACFTITANKITIPGNKTLYMRILAPDGHVLSAPGGKNLFEFNGVKGLYSVSKQIDYENKEMDVCMSWEGNKNGENNYVPGEYVVSLYVDSAGIGRTKFTLK